MLIPLVLFFNILCKNAIVSLDCNDIYFEMYDFHLCPNNCIACSLHDSCILCLGNNSGSSCRAKCRVGCAEVYVSNGTLLRGCYKKKLGDICCMTCPHFSFCSDCLQFNGSCMKCYPGLYGSQNVCDKKCGHCQPDVDGVVECDINTGDCQDECIDGYYGRRCDKTCNENCIDLTANRTKCDKQSGNCIFGCISGRYNDTCASICSKTCLHSSCDQQSGNCTFGCIHGWYGDMCDKNCSVTCARLSCNQMTGHCTNGCSPGRYGYTCEDICSSKCNNTICTQSTGKCDSACLPGWYGDTCNVTCSSTCSGKSCNHLSGYCNNGCSAGWYGVTCEESCSSSCLDKLCNQTFGFCQNGCTTGSYGNMCEMKCNSRCYDKTCNHINGTCMSGCASGWYGDTCGESCSETCFNRSCEQFSGLCEKGCVAGYYGDNCEQNRSHADLLDIRDSRMAECLPECESEFIQVIWNQTTTPDQFSTLTVITYSLVGVVSAIIIALAICFIRRIVLVRRHNFQSDLEIPTIDISEPVYDEIDDPSVDKTSMATAKSTCSISDSYELNRADGFCTCRGSYEIPVSSATMIYGRMGASGINGAQPRNHQGISGYSSAFEREFECADMKSNHFNTTRETEKTKNNYTCDGLNEHQGGENENKVTIVNRESVLYLHPLS